MKTFMQFINEKLITFGGKAYPKHGNIVIMAGGAGSGKGFVLSKLVGIEGRVMDVDALKILAAKAPKIRKKVQDELGKDIAKIASNLSDPKNVSKLHDIVGTSLNLPDKKMNAFATSILSAHPERKPNIIFDVTLKNLSKLEKHARQAEELGYDKKNIHIVWVVNDIEVAKKQNLDPKRGRVVPSEILVNTHRGVSSTMNDILKMGDKLKKYMDGDIVLAFNKRGVDGKYVGRKGNEKAGFFKEANYVYVKRKGKPVTPFKSLEKWIKSKIAQYVPKEVNWEK